jgi:hypothetical protein
MEWNEEERVDVNSLKWIQQVQREEMLPRGPIPIPCIPCNWNKRE